MDDDLTSPKAAHDAVQELCDHVSTENVYLLQRLSSLTVALTSLIVTQVRHKAEEKAGKKFPEYTATSYRMRQNIVGASHSFIKVNSLLFY